MARVKAFPRAVLLSDEMESRRQAVAGRAPARSQPDPFTAGRRLLGTALVAMSTQPPSDVRDHLSDVVNRVAHQHERVVVTRNGRPTAVILSPEGLDQLHETIDVPSDPGPWAIHTVRSSDCVMTS
jgi:antitoxin YefM